MSRTALHKLFEEQARRRRQLPPDVAETLRQLRERQERLPGIPPLPTREEALAALACKSYGPQLPPTLSVEALEKAGFVKAPIADDAPEVRG